MSIVRIGLAQTKKFGAGYDAIFAKKTRSAPKAKPAPKTKSAKKK